MKSFIRMSLRTPELVRRAFQIKYGYPTELSADEIYQEFERRYNLALDVRQTSGSDLSWTKILEGMSLLKEPAETEAERARRRSAIQTLATAAGYPPLELDLLAEEYLARLEVRWIREG
jgi:formiminotetrahydrofolate cyclodeaminase